MNEDSLHSWIDPELEARIVALVVGEASDFEREELERLIAERPELGIFRKRMEAMHDLLGHAGSEPVDENEDWKLSDDRRRALLDSFDRAPGTILEETEEAEESPGPHLESASPAPRRRSARHLIQIAAAITIIALILGLSFPATMALKEGTASLSYSADHTDRQIASLGEDLVSTEEKRNRNYAWIDSNQPTTMAATSSAPREEATFFQSGGAATALDELSDSLSVLPVDDSRSSPSQGGQVSFAQSGHGGYAIVGHGGRDADITNESPISVTAGSNLTVPTGAGRTSPARGFDSGAVVVDTNGTLDFPDTEEAQSKLPVQRYGDFENGAGRSMALSSLDEPTDVLHGGVSLSVTDEDFGEPPSPEKGTIALQEGASIGITGDESIAANGSGGNVLIGGGFVAVDAPEAGKAVEGNAPTSVTRNFRGGTVAEAEVGFPYASETDSRQARDYALDIDSISMSEGEKTDAYEIHRAKSLGLKSAEPSADGASARSSSQEIVSEESALQMLHEMTPRVVGGGSEFGTSRVQSRAGSKDSESQPSKPEDLSFRMKERELAESRQWVRMEAVEETEKLSQALSRVAGDSNEFGIRLAEKASPGAAADLADSSGNPGDVLAKGATPGLADAQQSLAATEAKGMPAPFAAPAAPAAPEPTSDPVPFEKDGATPRLPAVQAGQEPLLRESRSGTERKKLAKMLAAKPDEVARNNQRMLGRESSDKAVEDLEADVSQLSSHLAAESQGNRPRVDEEVDELSRLSRLSVAVETAPGVNHDQARNLRTRSLREIESQWESSVPGSAGDSFAIAVPDQDLGGIKPDVVEFDGFLDFGRNISGNTSLADIDGELDESLVAAQPAQTEWHRYPGHPATTHLDPSEVAKFYDFSEDDLEGMQRGDLARGIKVLPDRGRQVFFKLPAPPELEEISATDEPFSTFSLHVSDVSFQLAQSSLGQGEWPDAERIRIEEFVNAFDYGDPMPSQDDKVSCTMEQSIHPFLQQRNLLRVSMRTAAAGRATGVPLRLTFLLDNSGSMERIDRQETVRRAFALLAEQLQPADQVTLITFARQPRLVADQVSGEKARGLTQVVANLPSEGGTNLEQALELAFEKAREQQEPNAQNRIILLTDGAANLGDAEPDSLAQRIEMIRNQGIAFDAAGIGTEGLNDEILEALTRRGDGRYYLLGSPEEAGEGFARQIAGALRPAAGNVKVQVEFNPDRVGQYKLLGFEKHRLAKEDFRNDKVDAAEMAAEEAGIALYQFEPRPDGKGDIGFVSVRFRDMATGDMVERKWVIPYDPNAPRPEQASPSLRVVTSAALLGAKLDGGPLADVIELDELSRLVSELPDAWKSRERITALGNMISQARELEGQ